MYEREDFPLPFLALFTHPVHPDDRGGGRAARRGAPGVGGDRGDRAPDRRRARRASGRRGCSGRLGVRLSARGGSSTCCCAPGRRATCSACAAAGSASRSCARNPHGIVLAEHLAPDVLRKQIRHRTGAVRLDPPEILEDAERLARRNGHDPDFPLRLIGLRELRSHNSWMHNSPLLMRGGRTPRRPDPPRRRRRRSGSPTASRVRISSAHGAIEIAGAGHRRGQARARSPSRTAGATAAAGASPNAAGGANVNELASSDPADLERLAGMAHLNGIPIRVERIETVGRRRRAAAEPARSASRAARERRAGPALAAALRRRLRLLQVEPRQAARLGSPPAAAPGGDPESRGRAAAGPDARGRAPRSLAPGAALGRGPLRRRRGGAARPPAPGRPSAGGPRSPPSPEPPSGPTAGSPTTAPRAWARARLVGADRADRRPRAPARARRRVAEPRAEQDQHQADERPGSRSLVEHRDSASNGDHRGDVGDHERAAGADLDHQRGVDGERGRGAEQRRGRPARPSPRPASATGRRVERRRRGQHQRGDRERGAHRRPRVEVGEMALEHHRPDRVAERREQDRGGAEELVAAAGDVDPDQRGDAGEADQQPREPRAGDPLGVVEAEREQGDEQRRRGDEDRRERGGRRAARRPRSAGTGSRSRPRRRPRASASGRAARRAGPAARRAPAGPPPRARPGPRRGRRARRRRRRRS